MSSRDSETLVFSGVDFSTGRYLRPPIAAREMGEMWNGLRAAKRPQLSSRGEISRFSGEGVEHLRRNAVTGGQLSDEFRFWAADIDPRELHSSGWGAIFGHGADPACRLALAPLLEHRRRLATARQEHLFRELTYRPGEDLYSFLERHGVGPGVADPQKLPYYLMIVGGPEEIPFEFQFELDVQYAVGRLCFAAPADYGRYAAKVLAAEARNEERPPRVAFFATRHQDDPATERSAGDLIEPLARKIEHDRPGCRVEVVIAEAATKQRFLALLAGRPGGAPDLLFTSSHGLGLESGHPRFRELQGALLTSDWAGPAAAEPAPPESRHIVSGADLAGGPEGAGAAICFLHGCFTAGTPQLETFGAKYLGERRVQAPEDQVSALAQGLLAGGALAVIGHVDKTWTSSFRWRRAGAQIQTYETAIKELLSGKPVGLAMEAFGLRHAELSAILQSAFDTKGGGEAEITHLWLAHHDARNFIVLGDPAIRLPAAIPPPAESEVATLQLPLPPAEPAAASASAAARGLLLRRAGNLTRRRPAVHNLEIRIALAGEGFYRCSLTAGSQSKSARIDLERCKSLGAEIYQRVSQELLAPERAAQPSSLLKEAGAELFEALFSGPLLGFYERILERPGGRPVRLLVHLDPESRSRAFLAAVPWEWLYWREKQDFLSLNRRTPVLRLVEVDAPAPTEKGSERLRVLIVTSEHRPAPAIATECVRIREALAGNRRIEVEIRNGVSLTSLREAFEGDGFQVLHFIGHGLYARSEASAQLVLEEPSGRRYTLSGEDLAQTLRDFGMLRLVFFNSCDSARTDDSGYRPFAGVAQALLQNGVPAVIAMQFPISHPAAIAFSERFYRSLTAGDPLDAAMAEGRQAIRTARPDSLEWGTPVLFVRTTSLEILEPPSSRRLFRAAFAALLVVLLLLVLAPPPSRAQVVLQLSTAYLRFQLPAEETQVFDRMILRQLGAADLRRIELPASSVALPASPRYDLLLASGEQAGSITLQQGRLPGGTSVALHRAEGGTFELAIEAAEDFAEGHVFEAVVAGPYRALVRPKNRPPERFAGEPAAPDLFRFLPRARRLDLELDFRRYGGQEFSSPIRIEKLELFEVRETEGAAGTELAAKFHLSGEAVVEGGDPVELPAGSQLRLVEPRGVLQRIAPNENGIELIFSGSVAGISEGPREQPQDLMPRRPPLVESFTKLVGLVAALMTLIEFASLARPLLAWARFGKSSRPAMEKT